MHPELTSTNANRFAGDAPHVVGDRNRVDRPRGAGRLARARRFPVGSTALHLFAFAIAYAAAFLLRYDYPTPPAAREVFWQTIYWVLPLKVVVFAYFACIHSRWRFVSLTDLARVIEASIVSAAAMVAIDVAWASQIEIPWTIVVLDCGGAILLLSGLRCSARVMREYVYPTLAPVARRPVLILGADSAGEAVGRLIHAHPALNYRVVGFLDDNALYRGSNLGGIPLVGLPADALAIAQRRGVRDLIVISGSICGRQLRSLVDSCRDARINVKMIPPLEKILDQSYRLEVRDVEINDLLHRAPIQMDTEMVGDMVRGKVVLVSGAGGSIGSELCRQVAMHEPAGLVLCERAENSLFQIEQCLLQDYPGVKLYPCLADVGERDRISELFRRYRPDVVFHAAAHKHVPLMEENAGEAIKNNVFGTKTLAEVAHRSGVDRFILISTDKAVKPSSVMGLTKRLAERIVFTLDQISSTKFVAVRFGNVLDSNGSVVPTFRRQIRQGGPVTITHEKMERFFMTIPEASQLVLQAAALGEGGEVFLLDMGEPVKIIDLARDLIRLSGFENGEIDVEVIGIRPGEKLYEELSEPDEHAAPTSHPKLRRIAPAEHDPAILARQLEELARLVAAPAATIRLKLRGIVAEKRDTLHATTASVASVYRPGASELQSEPAATLAGS